MNNDDQKLKSLYRELSNETAPAHLDRKVLDVAQRPDRQNWPPLALAATVLLSFAFVLNLDVEKLDSPTTSSFHESENLAATSAPVADRVRTTQMSADASTLASEAPMIERSGEARNSLAKAQAIEELNETRQSDIGVRAFAETPAKRAKIEHPAYCSDAASAAPGSWYACVLELRKRGMADEANQEQSRLLTKFPDFEIR